MKLNSLRKVTRRTPVTTLRPLCLGPRLHPQPRLPLNTLLRQIPLHPLLHRQRYSRLRQLQQSPLIAMPPLSCLHCQKSLLSNQPQLPKLQKKYPRIQRLSQALLPTDRRPKHHKRRLRRLRVKKLQHLDPRSPGPTFSRELHRELRAEIPVSLLQSRLQVLPRQTTSRYPMPFFPSVPILTVAKFHFSSQEVL